MLSTLSVAVSGVPDESSPSQSLEDEPAVSVRQGDTGGEAKSSLCSVRVAAGQFEYDVVEHDDGRNEDDEG